MWDWKVYTIVGKGHHQANVTLAERKSRLSLQRKVDRRTVELGSEAMIVMLQSIADLTHTIIRDNGNGFGEHERTTHDLAADFFLAHLYTAWECGANENMYELIRKYFPKERMFFSIMNKELELIMVNPITVQENSSFLCHLSKYSLSIVMHFGFESKI